MTTFSTPSLSQQYQQLPAYKSLNSTLFDLTATLSRLAARMNNAVTFLLLTALVTVIANPSNPDCRIFVFAPKCRGVAAKRAQAILPKEYIIGLKNLRKTLNGVGDWLTEDAPMTAITSNRHDEPIEQPPNNYDYKK